MGSRYSHAPFAVREAVQESLGFSSFELVFNRTVRGPLKLPKENWLQGGGIGPADPTSARPKFQNYNPQSLFMSGIYMYRYYVANW